MSRNFKFESQLNADLSCSPIAARQKLDALGIKIRSDQWLALEMNERRKINDLPAESDSEKRQFAEFVNNIVKERSGELLSQLTMEQQTAAVPTDAISQVIADNAREHGFELDSASWAKLDYDQRYVLLKFGSDERRRGTFAAALKEFFADL
jgi:hypothetical protein